MPLAEVPSQGPRTAKIMVVGEAPGQKEVESLQPFVGYSGILLSEMLRETGFNRTDCYVTNVCKFQPPGNEINRFFGTKTSGYPAVMGRYPGPEVRRGLEQLEQDIQQIDPDLILAFGNTALWATTGQLGIGKWRGSVLECRELPGYVAHGRAKVIPTYHPAAILRQYPLKFIAQEDLRRARREIDLRGRRIEAPEYRFQIRPGYAAVLSQLSLLQARVEAGPTWLAVDIETQRRKIDCIGFAWSTLDAMCIPFIAMDGGCRPYWSLEEHTEIVWRILQLLTHPNCHVVGQNFPYDTQYIAKEWGFLPNLKWDIMTIWHSIFCLLPKSLDFQSSLLCDFHRFWKEDAKDEEGKRLDDESHWVYNCRDNVVTYECREKQAVLLDQLNFRRCAGETPQERQMSLHTPILKGMLRGVQISKSKRAQVLGEVEAAISGRENFISTVVGHALNPRSPPKLQAFFYHDMRIRPIISRKTRSPTCDEDALSQIAKRDPLLAPICHSINEVRSLGTYRAVCEVPLDRDGRIRCSYIIPGTDTYRFASKTDAFGFGTNLQNITSGTEDMEEDQLAIAIAKGVLLKPNLRKLLVPDPGFTLVEYDLPQADAQVVAWEAGDEILKAIFRDPTRDLHTENAKAIFGACSGKGDPRRQMAKIGVHSVNYRATARTLAQALGITIQQAEGFILMWFKAHPGIGGYPEPAGWQLRVYNDMVSKRYVENAFGYRRYCFDRPDEDLKHALAWTPQSTVATITNTGIRRVDQDLATRGVQFLLQVHDSAVFQIWTKDGPELARAIQERMVVEVPYSDPLRMIPDAKFSESSWGECERRKEWLRAA